MSLTASELYTLLTEAAGEPEDGHPGDAFAETGFADLGYDSLALMETAVRIHDTTGVRIPDEQLAELHTPRAVLELVNSRLAATGPR